MINNKVRTLNSFNSVTVLLLILLTSCKHEVPVPSTPVISFGNEISHILNNNCTQSGCHGSQNFVRFQLITYDDLIKHGGVGNGDATKTKLYQAITGKGEDIMPPSPYAPLSDPDIKRILLWIRQGAKNN